MMDLADPDAGTSGTGTNAGVVVKDVRATSPGDNTSHTVTFTTGSETILTVSIVAVPLESSCSV